MLFNKLVGILFRGRDISRSYCRDSIYAVRAYPYLKVKLHLPSAKPRKNINHLERFEQV